MSSFSARSSSEPNLAFALRRLAIRGPLVSISAGWQEREGELDELHAHVGMPVTDLGLYARAEAVLAADAELAAAYRQRQGLLRELQDLYRLRLTYAKDATRELLSRDGDPALVRSAQRASLRALRTLDREHLRAIEREHAGFRRRLRPQQRASVVPHIRELRRAHRAGSRRAGGRRPRRSAREPLAPLRSADGCSPARP